jgi:aldehyde dehydrogenase (NAD+)
MTRFMPACLEADQMVIAGQAVAGGGVPLQVEDPATEEVFATVPTADADQVETAIATARTSFDAGVWADLPRSERLAA